MFWFCAVFQRNFPVDLFLSDFIPTTRSITVDCCLHEPAPSKLKPVFWPFWQALNFRCNYDCEMLSLAQRHTVAWRECKWATEWTNQWIVSWFGFCTVQFSLAHVLKINFYSFLFEFDKEKNVTCGQNCKKRSAHCVQTNRLTQDETSWCKLNLEIHLSSPASFHYSAQLFNLLHSGADLLSFIIFVSWFELRFGFFCYKTCMNIFTLSGSWCWDVSAWWWPEEIRIIYSTLVYFGHVQMRKKKKTFP